MKKIIALILIVAVIIAIYVSYRMKMSNRNAVDELISRKQMINVLIAGRNEYDMNLHKFFAIVSINPENNKIGITFLPPTLLVDIDGDDDPVKLEQIEMGKFGKLSKALEKSLKMKISFYMTIYAPDVIKTVDLIEGIELFILNPLNTFEGLTNGLNFFDGKKTMEYINRAEKNSIFRKYDRVQDILYSIYINKEKYKPYVNSDLIAIVLSNVKTNLFLQEITSLSDIVLKDGELLFTTLPGKVLPNGGYAIDEISYSIYEKRFLKKLVIEEKGERNIKVKLLNATSIPGLAQKVRSILIREGINVVEFGNYSGENQDETIIINQKGDTQDVKFISKILGINKMYTITDNTELHNIMVIVGKDMEK